jgi:hypothetical protein
MSIAVAGTLEGRVDALDRDRITDQLDGGGFAVTEWLLDAEECAIANEWSRRLRGDEEFPLEHAELLERCAAAGRHRPTPLILRYGEGVGLRHGVSTITARSRTALGIIFHDAR